MIKSLLGCSAAVFLATVAVAQGTELFPELAGRFQPAQPTTQEQSDAQAVTPAAGAQPDAVQSGAVAPEQVTESAGEGNIEIHLEELNGKLALARNYSYCFADAVLENKTNVKLERLTITLSYQGSPNVLKYANVEKKGTQTQKIMMIGPECQAILSEPEIEIQECKLGQQTEDACKKKVQFIPPNS